LAEVTGELEINNENICDKDLSWIVEIWEALACPITMTIYYSKQTYEKVWQLKKFFIKIMNIWTEEVKTFSFIQNANAWNFIENLPKYDNDKENFIVKMTLYIKWFIYFVFLFLSIWLIIIFKRE